jgi:hypothetical protein
MPLVELDLLGGEFNHDEGKNPLAICAGSEKKK